MTLPYETETAKFGKQRLQKIDNLRNMFGSSKNSQFMNVEDIGLLCMQPCMPTPYIEILLSAKLWPIDAFGLETQY